MSASKPSPIRSALEWLGFATPERALTGGHNHEAEAGEHGHTHGVVDASITTSARGIWAIKWSFVILAATAALQLAVVFVSGSVALLADTIHNIGDAATAIPLWIAFALARRQASARFTYGFGRVEDFAGMAVVAIILVSALVAGYEAIDRLLHPLTVTMLPWVIAAGVVGFIGNEVVAVFRIRVGREIESAALIADGYHARTDGLTSLAVVAGAVGVWLGFPLADPIIGLLITLAIFGIVWQSATAVMTRALDGVEPAVGMEIRHAAEHAPEVQRVSDVKARWIGHRLHADITIEVNDALTVAAANGVAGRLRQELVEHIPALRTANIMFGGPGSIVREGSEAAHGHHHAPEPFRFAGELGQGVLEIVDTLDGERMRVTFARSALGLAARVEIARPEGQTETLQLEPALGDRKILQSVVAPAEPHEFAAVLYLVLGERTEALPFRMAEPAGHGH